MNLSKLENMILFFSTHPMVTDLGATKLHKLIYFSDVLHLREHGQSISESDYIKYPHGPVPSRGEKMIKHLTKAGKLTESRKIIGPEVEMRPISGRNGPNLRVFSEIELITLQFVAKNYGSKSASHLSHLSHLEPAWICANKLTKLSHSLMMYGPEEDPSEL